MLYLGLDDDALQLRLGDGGLLGSAVAGLVHLQGEDPSSRRRSLLVLVVLDGQRISNEGGVPVGVVRLEEALGDLLGAVEQLQQGEEPRHVDLVADASARGRAQGRGLKIR